MSLPFRRTHRPYPRPKRFRRPMAWPKSSSPRSVGRRARRMGRSQSPCSISSSPPTPRTPTPASWRPPRRPRRPPTHPAPVAVAPADDLNVIAVPQDTPPVPEAEEVPEANGLAEVIVTAQRRSQSAQDVPVSVTVLDQQQLANANITNAGDLATYTPSLQTNQRFGPDSASFAIRGFTQDLRTTASVGVYFADVVAPRGQSSQTSGDGAGPGELFDLENVQVLRGRSEERRVGKEGGR